MHKSIVIGAGPAGLAAAIYLARAGLEPLVIKGLEPSNHVMTTLDVEYLPGVSSDMTGPALLDSMSKQAEQFGAKVLLGTVSRVDLSSSPYTVTVEGRGKLQTQTLIIATGTSSKLLGIPGEQQRSGRGVYTCAPCHGYLFRGKKVIVVGGGDSAMEEAEYLTHYASEVTVVNRRTELRASNALKSKVRTNSKVKWVLNRTPLEVLGDENGVTGLSVSNNATGLQETVDADGIFLAVGKKPNTGFLHNQLPVDPSGYIIVKPGSTETGLPGVFACGDVQDKRYGHLLSAVGSGTMAAIDCERFLFE